MTRRKVQARRKKRVRRKTKGRELNGYRSGFELGFSKELKKYERKGKLQHWGYELEAYEYYLLKTYTPDFILTTASGKVIYIETKGRFEGSDRTKHLEVRKQHPELDVRFVFMKDQYITKAKRTKYSDWCRQHGFKYSIGEIDEDWLDE